MTTADPVAPPPGTPPVLPWLHAVVIWVIALVLIIAFVVIGLKLGLVPVYAGFLLWWYWSTVGQSDPRALIPALAGSIFGTSLSWLLQTGVLGGNVPLIVAALALMALTLLLLIAGRLPWLCNGAATLTITIFNAPVIQGHEDFRGLLIATVLGFVWFGATILAIVRLAPKT